MITTTAITTTPTLVFIISERCLREELFVREKEEKKKVQNLGFQFN